MSEQILNKQLIKLNERKISESISQIFLCFLEDYLTKENLHDFFNNDKFTLIENYSPNLSWNAFQDLVNLSVEYLHVPIGSVLTNFSAYLKKYKEQNLGFICNL